MSLPKVVRKTFIFPPRTMRPQRHMSGVVVFVPSLRDFMVARHAQQTATQLMNEGRDFADVEYTYQD